MSGLDAQRGFIYQTIVAMIECLDKDDWDEIKLEPETDKDKVDIAFYSNGGLRRAIQVKSTRNIFQEYSVKKWLKYTVEDAQKKGAEEVCLYLVGNTSLCKNFITKVNREGENKSPKEFIKEVDFGDIKKLCWGTLFLFIGKARPNESVTYNFVDSEYYLLFGIVHENSISCRKLSREEFKTILGMNINNAISRGKDLQTAKTVRKLSDNLWVNWKTGRLGSDPVSALYHEKDADNLSPAELRLLSVLVQGEGAVVGWEELVRRGFKMQEEIDSQKTGRRLKDSRDEVDDEAYSLEAAPDSGKSIYPNAEEANIILEKARTYAEAAVARGVEIDIRSLAVNVRESISAIRKLCKKAPTLSEIIRPAENGTGFRIKMTGSGIENAGEFFPTLKGTEPSENEWKKLIKVDGGYYEAEGWLRCHYAKVCGSFEGSISNAEGNIKQESRVFGNYRMVEAYINAYTKKNKSDRNEALLDYVEKWYKENHAILSDNNRIRDDDGDKRVLVLHGQPGDGKTTFCKKAVYAHCFEGWLAVAPNVIRVSLNNNENGGIVQDNGLSLPKSISFKRAETDAVISCAPNQLCEGTLVIFDGYDELVSDLNGDKDASKFADFYERVKEYAKKLGWFIIITSRSMCIKRELEEKMKNFEGGRVASFEPMTALQQDLIINRMIELNKAPEDLKKYQLEELPGLRQNEELKKLLGIPILFRMIVAVRFKDDNSAETKAELYGSLFSSLIDYKGKKNEKTNLLTNYEEIAAEIFNYNNDTCPLNNKISAENKELIYLFLTKNEYDTKKASGDEEDEKNITTKKGRGKLKKREGQIGFLHGSFRQYFFARYLVSKIKEIGAGNNEKTFVEFFMSLCRRRINEDLVWQFVKEISMLKGSEENDPFWEIDDREPMTVEDISAVRKCLNDDMAFVRCMEKIDCKDPVMGDEKPRWELAENAVFNLLYVLSMAEKACIEFGDDEDANAYFGYKNIVSLLRKGDYHNIYLEKADFSDCNLNRVNFQNSQMEGAVFKDSERTGDSNLIRAEFTNALLSNARFTGTDLSGADFIHAVLKGACFENTTLQGANFSGADLKDATFNEEGMNLEDVNLAGAKPAKAHFVNANLKGANLSGADLTRKANFNGANMVGANLAGAYLTGATLIGANLAGADFRGAWLIGADFSGAHLEEALLDGVILKDAVLVGAHLEQTRIINVELCGANLTNAHLEGAILKGSYLDALVADAGGYAEEELSAEANLAGASFDGADVSGSYLSKRQYQDVRKNGAAGQPYSLIGEKHVLPGIRGTKALMIARGMRAVVFGRYRQGKNGEVLPLRWRVLTIDTDNHRALMVTEKLIDCRRYHNVYTDITWEECDLRKWLKNEFLNIAFTEQERKKIYLTHNNPDNTRYVRGINGGKDTDDKIFLLSLDETEKYFGSYIDRRAAGTDYAINQRLDVSDDRMGWWWLRSPGSISRSAACVRPGGSVSDVGRHVDIDLVGVRPALWLNL